jgi:hypothetical protein
LRKEWPKEFSTLNEHGEQVVHLVSAGACGCH